MQGVWGKRSADDSINDEMVKKSLSAIRALGKRELLSLAGKGKAIWLTRNLHLLVRLILKISLSPPLG
jgi:hypothetical protein